MAAICQNGNIHPYGGICVAAMRLPHGQALLAVWAAMPKRRAALFLGLVVRSVATSRAV
jgi:hypothetical protein